VGGSERAVRVAPAAKSRFPGLWLDLEHLESGHVRALAGDHHAPGQLLEGVVERLRASRLRREKRLVPCSAGFAHGVEPGFTGTPPEDRGFRRRSLLGTRLSAEVAVHREGQRKGTALAPASYPLPVFVDPRRREQDWPEPCQERMLALQVELCSPRSIASRVEARWQPSGFWPGLWPQGQSNESTHLSYPPRRRGLDWRRRRGMAKIPLVAWAREEVLADAHGEATGETLARRVRSSPRG
jgi:hypothetical protein